MADIKQIMRDKAKNRKSGLGDHWSDSWCNDAADRIEALEAAARSALIALNQVPNTAISGKYKKTYEVCTMLEKVLKVKTLGDDDDEN